MSAPAPAAADLVGLRRDLLRFAVLQLRDEAAAEDAVQETLLAACRDGAGFAGRAQWSTWVFGILRHKIVDAIRQRVRQPQPLAEIDEIPEDAFDDLFRSDGHWRAEERPAAWGDPEAALSRAEFWEVFRLCLTRLPENTARVFMMREYLGFDTREICGELSITAANCWVVLHRARMSLRLCLQERWFAGEGGMSC